MALGCRAVTKIPSPRGAGAALGLDFWVRPVLGAQGGVGEDLCWFWSKLVSVQHLGLSDAASKSCPDASWLQHFSFLTFCESLAGLETLKMATASWWGINFGDQGPDDLGIIVSQVLYEQSTLSCEQRCCRRGVQGSRRLCSFSPPWIHDNLDFPAGNRFPRGWEGRCRFK